MGSNLSQQIKTKKKTVIKIGNDEAKPSFNYFHKFY